MKWLALTLFAVVVGFSTPASAQKVVPIGSLPVIEERGPASWAMSGFTIVNLTQSDGHNTPIMRTAVMDARLVEILSRTQAPPLRASDIRPMSTSRGEYIVVRNYLLAEVRPQDAKAVNMSVPKLANRWAASMKRVLPQIAPVSNRFGI